MTAGTTVTDVTETGQTKAAAGIDVTAVTGTGVAAGVKTDTDAVAGTDTGTSDIAAGAGSETTTGVIATRANTRVVGRSLIRRRSDGTRTNGMRRTETADTSIARTGAIAAAVPMIV